MALKIRIRSGIGIGKMTMQSESVGIGRIGSGTLDFFEITLRIRKIMLRTRVAFKLVHQALPLEFGPFFNKKII